MAEDWPFTYEDLRPFYDEVTHHIGASGLEGDPSYPDAHTFPLPPLPIGKAGLRAARGMDKLGWHWWPAPNAISSRAFRNRPACQRYGACESGCPAGAKASADLTYWPDAIAAGAVLITGARVRSLTVDEKGLVAGAEFVDRDGRWHHQGAGLTILAANGLGTPRILLNSATSAHPDGLANSSGLVGKRLMIHPYASVYGTYDEDLESHLGPAGQALQSLEFYETDESRGFVRGGKWNLMPTPGALNRVLWEPGTALARRLRQPLPRQAQRHLRSHPGVGHHHRGPARREQRDRPGPRAHRLRRDPCCQAQLQDRREQPEAARLPHRACRRGARGRRRAEHRGRSGGPRQRLAPAG